MKILILEDEQRNAKRLIRLLNDIDRTFIVEGPLASIKETVEFFQSGKTTDLILADIRLTDGLSFEALKHAQATVPIIFTTAYDEYAVQAFKFNSFDYLLKPLDPDELEAAIDKAVKAGKNYTDENLQQLFDALQKSKFRYTVPESHGVGIGTVIQVISILHSRRLSDFLLRQRQYFRQFLRGIIPRKMNTCHVFQVPIQARSQ